MARHSRRQPVQKGSQARSQSPGRRGAQGPPSVQAAKDLQTAITGSEIVRVEGRQAYIVYPDGIGRSRLTTALIEKKLRTRGTGRNWNTVLKLEGLVGA
jgi:uncharacterized protein (DUF1697 family)